MRTLLPLLLLLGVETGSRAAQVSFNFTNNVTGLPDTNTFRVIPIDNYVESGGGFIVKGPPVRLTPKADGRITNSLEQGDYVVTNTAVSQGFIIRVPLDHGATIYNATSGTDNGGLALSGFNRFVTITYGTNLPPTFDEVTNALGGPILLADAVTNTANSMASRITNGFTAIVYTNPAVVLTTNFLPTLTNGFITSIITNTLATTNYVHGQGFVTSSVTNGLATTNYVNAVANTNGINVAAGNSFVTLVTNAGLVTISGVNQTNGFTSLATTNASQVVYTNQLIILTNGYVKSSITNGLAPTNYVHGQGFVTSTVTNGLATITYVDSVANTNGVNVSPGNTFVTMVTNSGLVTISGVNQTNGFLKTRWTTNNDTAAIDGSKLVNVVATNVSAPITNRWRQDITNAIDANVLNPDLLTLNTNATSVFVNTVMIVATNSSQALRFTNANNLFGGTLTNSANVGTAFSSRGTLIGSEQFGLNATATAIQSTAIGYNSVAGSTYATAIGATAEAGNGGFTGDVAIGPATDADGGYATAIGFGASATATNALGIGDNSYADGNNAIAIGSYSRASNANSIVIGFNSRSLADNQIVFGGASSTAYFPGNAQFDGSLTNGSVTLTNLSMGGRAMFQQNTNVIEITGAGSSIANGMYFRSAGWWTNSMGAYLTNISGVHYIYSNAVTLYSSAGLENATWTQVSGALPVPASYKGSFVPGSALFVTGSFAPTNLLSIINPPTNSATDGYVLSTLGGKTLWIPTAGAGVLTNNNASAVTFSSNLTVGGVIAGNGSSLTNVTTTYGRFVGTTSGQLPLYDTNTLFIEEQQVKGIDPVNNSISVSGQYAFTNGGPIAHWYTPTNLPTNPNCIMYQTNFISGQEVWVIHDFQLSQDVYYLTNNNTPSVFPRGPWYPNIPILESVITYNIDPMIATNSRLVGTVQTYGESQISQQAYDALRHHHETRSTWAGNRPIVEITQTEAPYTAVVLTNTVTFIKQNNLDSFVDVVTMGRWVGGRDAAGNQTFSDNFPGMTLNGYANYLHTNGLKAGLYYDYGMFGTNGTISQGPTGSQGYYHQDATNSVFNGIDFALLDTTVDTVDGTKNPQTLINEFTLEFHTAAAQFSHPFFVMGANAGGFGSFQDWMPNQDAWWFGNDGGDNPFFVIEQSRAWTGRGKYPILCNPGSMWNSNSVVARKFFGLAAIAPAHMQVTTNFFNSNVLPLTTNLDFLSIWRDAAGSPGWLVASNATGEIWARSMANGDIAVYFVNFTISPGSLTLNWVDLKLATNVQMFCQDVFALTNDVKTISLTRALAASEGSLWRISPTYGIGTGPAYLYADHSPTTEAYHGTDGAFIAVTNWTSVNSSGFSSSLTQGTFTNAIAGRYEITANLRNHDFTGITYMFAVFTNSAMAKYADFDDFGGLMASPVNFTFSIGPMILDLPRNTRIETRFAPVGNSGAGWSVTNAFLKIQQIK